MKTFSRLVCGLLMIFSFEYLFIAKAIFAQDNKIFILHSYHQEYPWTKAENNGFTQTLTNNFLSGNINFSTEYLDTKRVKFSREYQEFFFHYLKQKYDNYSPDVIFCSDDNALSFFLHFREKLFADAPVVFCGVNNLAVKKELDPKKHIGIFEKKEILPNLALIKKIIPKPGNILFLGDNSFTHKVIEQKIRADISSQMPDQKYEFITSRNLSSLVKQLKSYDKGIIFLTTIGEIKDEHDNVVPLKKTLAAIVNAGDFTTISMEDAYIENGILGGYVTNGFSQGKEAASLAVRILNGDSPASIPLGKESPNQYMFNYPQLKKFGLSLSQLPEKSIILNRPQSYYELYKFRVWSTIFFFIFQTVVIAVLIINVYKRKNAETLLQKAHDHLEKKVSERTSDLIETNTSLTDEILGRQRTEEMLREREEELKSIFRAAPTGIGVVCDRVITQVNDRVCEMTGYSREELIGQNARIFYPTDEDFEYVGREKYIQIKERGTGTVETRFKRKNGEIIHVLMSSTPLDSNDLSAGVTFTALDITKSKQAEEEKLIAQKLAADQGKQALVGEISGKMAHDFNNILGIIMGNTELALLDCRDVQTKKTLDLIYAQTLRGKNLTKNLVAFAKDQEPKQEFFRISEKIDLVVNLMRKDLEGIELITEESPGVPELLADPGMIEHALVNLIQNSIHAVSMVKYPRIIIRTYSFDKNICFEIEDNGCGIPRENLEDIYGPSFTLKGSRDLTGSYRTGIKGTGYGMVNIKKYVEQHKGTIFVESESNSGTKFTISLPVIKKELSSEEKAELRTGKAHFKKHILLVEDEAAIADVQYRILTQEPCNHKVDIANNGQVAMDLFGKHKYDLVSLDYILPGKFNGMDVYHHIRAIDKTIPILFISGNIEFLESIKELKQKDAEIDHLSKPCQNKDYINRINGLFERIVG